jgi:hypothetical protein
MIPPMTAASIAQTVLHLKSPRARAFTRELGRKQVGPRDYLSCMRVSEACRFIKSLAPEARRYFIAERKAKWLTDVLVVEQDRKVFALKGVAPDGIPYNVHIDLPGDATLIDFLTAVMNCKGAPVIMRLDAAKTCAPLVHERPKPVVMVLTE